MRQVCDPALVRATETGNLDFAVRMCDYMDREGLRPRPRALGKLHDMAVSSMQADSNSTMAEMLAMVLEGWAESALGVTSDDEDADGEHDGGRYHGAWARAGEGAAGQPTEVSVPRELR